MHSPRRLDVPVGAAAAAARVRPAVGLGRPVCIGGGPGRDGCAVRLPGTPLLRQQHGRGGGPAPDAPELAPDTGHPEPAGPDCLHAHARPLQDGHAARHQVRVRAGLESEKSVP